MFGEVGEFIPRPTSQTPNGRGTQPSYLRLRLESWDLVGHILVSRIGDAGCTESGPMVPKQLLIRSQRRALVHLDSRNVVMEVETV